MKIVSKILLLSSLVAVHAAHCEDQYITTFAAELNKLFEQQVDLRQDIARLSDSPGWEVAQEHGLDDFTLDLINNITINPALQKIAYDKLETVISSLDVEAKLALKEMFSQTRLSNHASVPAYIKFLDAEFSNTLLRLLDAPEQGKSCADILSQYLDRWENRLKFHTKLFFKQKDSILLPLFKDQEQLEKFRTILFDKIIPNDFKIIATCAFVKGLEVLLELSSTSR